MVGVAMIKNPATTAPECRAVLYLWQLTAGDISTSVKQYTKKPQISHYTV